ncbi:MAG TPA: DUF2975 domain-containing protein [Alphaproteobacteria bacterium]|nr:DUF2975 domain-containing protein [Alphaproteobacteria bacterium]
MGLSGAARRLRVATLTVAMILPILAIVAVILPSPDDVDVAVRLDDGGLSRPAAGAIAILVMTLIGAGLFELSRMLRRVEAGLPFGPEATRHFRRFASFLIAAALAEILLPMLVTLASAISHHGFALAVDGKDLLFLLLSFVLFFLARLLDQAARYEEDSRAIV